MGPLATAGSYTYGVTCVGAGGTTAVPQTLMVGAVPVPVIQLNVTPLALAPGNSVAITWSTTNATSCTASGGAAADGWSGSQPTDNVAGFSTGIIGTAGQYTYTLTCTGNGGTAVGPGRGEFPGHVADDLQGL